ncbi:hypothetical protein GGI04_000427 [Coemansia thaxteri]|nr:hypothetical protein GGI04_000427 [Coemansia thaxteri]KAJ2474095.1 hypothetical protein GGI02_000367 [Coemansia sp. RSA 2322]KAJ2486363.1 hypothetical protein EV174_001161 [Coemansia sp. RSA 2320]
MKQRFSALDVRATVTALQQRIVGLRLQGIYDVNAKTFLLKFTKPEHKELVLIESGIRIHTSDYSRDKSITPSSFCTKLRKHLKARRLTAVRQIGLDRVVDFEFAVAAGASAEGTYHIICEFYASGNIILTDHLYSTLALLRVVHVDADTSFAVGKTYNLSEPREIEPVNKTALLECLAKAGPKDNLKRTLASFGAFGPALSEHVILRAKLSPSLRVSTALDLNPNSPQIAALVDAYQEAYDIVCRLGREVSPGYITYLPKSEGEGDGENKDIGDSVYDEFNPWMFEQHVAKPHTAYPSFADAADVFFSNLEAQKLKVKAHQQELAAEKKLGAIKTEHEGRVAALERAHRKTEEQARRIESNLEFVDQAIMIIRQAVAAGMDWKELEELVRDQQDQGNPIADRILKLNLVANQITLELDDPAEGQSDSDDSEPESSDSEGQRDFAGPLAVDVDIFESAFANAQRYYNSRRQAGVKHAKTLAISSQALQSAEQKIKNDLKATKVTATVSQLRKPFWFEKFSWFVSSDGYLVLAGRDMHQNELLVKRHLRSGDAYVHADIHGAATVVVKNRQESAAGEGAKGKAQLSAESIPPSTLFQAGIMSVCRSRAWDAKIMTSAWWVEAAQVSKTAPTGEYLSTGSFMIRGRKHLLPPHQLVYGFGFLFRLADDESVARHILVRQQRLAIMEENLRAAAGADSPAASRVSTGEDANMATVDPSADDASAIVVGCTPAVSASKAKSGAIDFNAARKKYNLDEVETAAVDDFSEEAMLQAPGTSSRSEGKRQISAKERRDQRKQRALGASGAEMPPPVPSESSGKLSKKEQKRLEEEKKFETSQQKQQNQQQQQQKRGQKSKSKKIKEKYAEQDDEDRELRMALLGAAGKKDIGGTIASSRAPATAASDSVANDMDADDLASAQPPSTVVDQLQALTVEPQADLAADSNVVMDALPVPGAVAAIAPAAANDDDDEDALDLSVDQLDVLDTLTAAPIPGDSLSFAIPVCAPYTALSQFKYRVKLVPGTMKKGKACKVALAVTLAAADGNKPRSTFSSDPEEADRLELTAILANREKELMKSVPESEMIMQMLGNAKVTAPNMEAMRQKTKFMAKAKAKAASKAE